MGTPVPVVVRGRRFPSVKACAEAFGVTPSAVSHRLSRVGHLDGLGLPRDMSYVRPARPVETIIFGVRFESRVAAAAALNVQRFVIADVARGTAGPKRRENVYAALMRWQARQEAHRHAA